jgi:gas vesicle protein
MSNSREVLAFLEGCIVGSLVGASLALLLAPRPGAQTRAQIRDKGFEFKDRTQERVLDASHRVQEQVHVLREKGKVAFEKGKHTAAEAISHSKGSFAEAVRHSKENVAPVMSQYKNEVEEEIPG